jgi:arabinose-5-phosphate isomerase
MVTQQAADVIRIEAEGLLRLAERIDESFARMVAAICSASGRVVIAGIGKSGLVGRKIVATLNSTGTRSLFLHPVEAMHGDLGIVCRDDVFLALSNSGETEELNMLVPIIRDIGCTVIALTGKTGSTLAKASDIVIDVGVAREACPLGLAPTASTTALLAMGDALAVVLINRKNFKTSDFRRFHPGGSLGHRLSRCVADFMLTGGVVPQVAPGTPMTAALKEIDRCGLGATLVVQPDGFLAGIVTDGDIRRWLSRNTDILREKVEAVMTLQPRVVSPETPAFDALNLMEHFQITVLPITNPIGKVRGVLHLHDILGKGEFKFNGR